MTAGHLVPTTACMATFSLYDAWTMCKLLESHLHLNDCHMHLQWQCCRLMTSRLRMQVSLRRALLLDRRCDGMQSLVLLPVLYLSCK